MGTCFSLSSSNTGVQRKTPSVGSNDKCAAMVSSCYCINDTRVFLHVLDCLL